MSTSYEQNLPCLNPHCKSHGKPHPNCRCYGFAEGGEVGHYCSIGKAHNPNCEYFSDGGTALSPEELEGAVPEQSNQQPLSPEELQGAVPEQQGFQAPLSPEELEGAIPQEEADSHAKYGTGGQQAITAMEGAAQGFAGPVATWTETHLLGVKPEDIAGRAKENPWIHGGAEAATFAGSMLLGTGEAALFGKAAAAAAHAAELAKLGKVGAAATKLAVEGMLFTGSDEITKAMLNQQGGDPSAAVSSALLHVGAAGLLSAATGGMFKLGEGLVGKGLQTLGGEEMAARLQDLEYRIGSTGDALGELGVTHKVTQLGSKIVAGKVALLAEPFVGGQGTYAVYDAVQKAIHPTVKKVTGWGANKINPYVTSAMLRVLSEDSPRSLPNVLHYANQMWKGAELARHGVLSCFGAAVGGQIAPPISDAVRDELKGYVEDGKITEEQQDAMQGNAEPQGFAHGGVAAQSSNDHFSHALPEQNMLLHSAKGRIANYLNNARPLPNQPKLPFDKEMPDIQKKRSYDQAIDIALSPLGVLDHINKGTLTPEYMKHYTSLYPEVHTYLAKELTKQISESQLKNGKPPPYHKRIGMSLFMGTNLDSTMSPMAIQTIQGIFAQKQMQQQAPTKNKKGTNSLSKISGSHLTDDQSRETRQQKV